METEGFNPEKMYHIKPEEMGPKEALEGADQELAEVANQFGYQSEQLRYLDPDVIEVEINGHVVDILKRNSKTGKFEQEFLKPKAA